MKGFLLREYTKASSTKLVDGKEQVIPAHKVYVYGVDGTDEELEAFANAKGDNIRYDESLRRLSFYFFFGVHFIHFFLHLNFNV